MRLHRLEAIQRLPIPVSLAWEFFADAGNLAKLTPPWLGMRVTSPLPPRMYPGMIVTYRIRPVAGVPVTWVTEITHVVDGKLFVDEQRFGPYRFWHHEHHFREVEGGVEVRDLVTYALPKGGGVAHRWMVAPRLKQIFDFRREFLTRTFGELT